MLRRKDGRVIVGFSVWCVDEGASLVVGDWIEVGELIEIAEVVRLWFEDCAVMGLVVVEVSRAGTARKPSNIVGDSTMVSGEE